MIADDLRTHQQVGQPFAAQPLKIMRRHTPCRRIVEVSAQEMNMLVQQAAQQYRPEDRQRFAEYLQNEPLAAAQLRAPLYEDKVVDFLFDKAEVTERTVTKDELQVAIEAEDAAPAPAKGAKKAPAKKAAAKK